MALLTAAVAIPGMLQMIAFRSGSKSLCRQPVADCLTRRARRVSNSSAETSCLDIDQSANRGMTFSPTISIERMI